jgi:hypothetical protein
MASLGQVIRVLGRYSKLYTLLEIALGVPQILCKMSLKTNSNRSTSLATATCPQLHLRQQDVEEAPSCRTSA